MTRSVSGLLYCGLGLIKSTIETQMKHKTTISVTTGGDFYHPEMPRAHFFAGCDVVNCWQSNTNLRS